MPIQKTTVEAILLASIEVFRRQGYYRTSMADLAKATGMTKGVFYHHFSNKEEVMLKALKMSCGYFEEKVFSIAYREKMPPKTRLDKMFQKAYFAFTEGNGGCFFANTILETAHQEPAFIEPLKQFFQIWEKALCQILSNKYEDQATCTAYAKQIIADIEGSIILMQLYNEPNYLTEALNRSKRIL